MGALKAILGLIALLCSVAICSAEPVTVLVPSQPYLTLKANGKSHANEVDVLIALMQPYDYISENMDRPQFMAAMYYGPKGKEPKLINLLGDVEEIRYNGKKAWGVNVGIEEPGLYQFVLEAKPWWNEAAKSYLHEQAKVILPVNGGASSWDSSFGQSFEILPRTRPYGLAAPAFFSGRILLDGKPLANLPVLMGRLNPAKTKAASQWDKELECRSNEAGEFAFLLKEAGWWYCEAAIPGQPLKGPDGEMSAVQRSTVLWIYVDGAKSTKK